MLDENIRWFYILVCNFFTSNITGLDAEKSISANQIREFGSPSPCEREPYNKVK